MSYESLEEAKKYHEQNKNFWTGESLAEYKYDVWTLIKQRNYKNILDYGCGKAEFHKFLFNNLKTPGSPMGLTIAKYDPAYIPYSIKPKGNFELVICTDVMEHVQEDKVEEVLKDIFDSGEYVFITITCYEATQVLLNGKNAHYTIKQPDWWKEKLKPYDGRYTAIFQTKPERGGGVVNKEPWNPNKETLEKLDKVIHQGITDPTLDNSQLEKSKLIY
jgi:hypothetical protein